MSESRNFVRQTPSRYEDVPIYRRRIYGRDGTFRHTEDVLGRRYTAFRAPEGAIRRRVSRGETLFSISLDVYGDSQWWYWIADMNPTLEDPLTLEEGSYLTIAPLPVRRTLRVAG